MSEEVSVIKCASCGADMIFDPNMGALRCPYCDSIKTVQKIRTLSRDFYKEKSAGGVVLGGATYTCPNCSGEVELEEFTTAAACPFCGATNIVKRENILGLKPDSILPFALSREKALEAGKKWIKRRVYAPTKAKKTFVADRFSGVYVPSFKFDTDSVTAYEGRLGEYYYVTVGSGQNRHQERRTRWFMVSGNYNRYFCNVVVEASRQLNQKEMTKILPFDIENIEEYKKEYLAGFSSERYDTGLDDSFSIAKEQIIAQIKSGILSGYHYDVVDYLRVDPHFINTRFNYMLVPLWVCGYKYREKMYRFIVNGRTGVSTGDYPVSPLRVGATIMFALGIIAVIAYFVINSNLFT